MRETSHIAPFCVMNGSYCSKNRPLPWPRHDTTRHHHHDNKWNMMDVTCGSKSISSDCSSLFGAVRFEWGYCTLPDLSRELKISNLVVRCCVVWFRFEIVPTNLGLELLRTVMMNENGGKVNHEIKLKTSFSFKKIEKNLKKIHQKNLKKFHQKNLKKIHLKNFATKKLVYLLKQ